MKKNMVLVAAMMIAGMVSAQEVEGFESAEIADSLIANVDTVELDPDPEWYVAPLNYDSVMARHNAPRRAAAANYHIDSVLTFNVDSVLTDVSIYEYGDTTRTITWAVNSDGTRTGKALVEEYTTATIVYNCSYDWDNTTNTWKGASRTVKEYNANGKQVANITYAWVNNAWVEDVKLTYAYDASNREIEFLTYNRNKSTNQLELSKARYREWYNSSKTTLDIQYTAYTNGTPTAGNKKEYEYDTFDNQSKYVYYSSYSNGNWVGSTNEEWEYATKTQKILYIKKTWSNGGWVNNTKEEWTYYGTTTNFTLHKKYSGSGSDWNITLEEIKEYNESGRNTLIENYSYTNGVKKGTKKEVYVYYGTTNNKTSTITYTWVAANADWTYNKKSINERNNFGIIDSYVELWSNGEWAGIGTRTVTTYFASNKPTNVVKQEWSATEKAWVNSSQTLTTYSGTNVTEVIDQIWSTTNSAWVNTARATTDYSGTKTTQSATYVWSTEINDWIGTGRSDWHYNAAGLEDTISTYRPVGTIWVDSLRTVKTYDAQNNNILTHNAKWNGEKWVMTSMTRRDIKDETVGGVRQTLNASWRCESDSIWVGIQRDSAAYLASEKLLYRIHCESWQNGDWVPVYRVEADYDAEERTLFLQQFDWNASSAQWIGFYRYEYTYDSEGRRVGYASFNSWDASNQSWIGTSKTGTVYDSDGSVRESIGYTWADNDWVYSQRYIYEHDSQMRTSQYIFQLYVNGEWTNSLKNEKDYFGDITSKDNTYIWLNGAWGWQSRNEQYYDEDAQGKLRRDIQGTWNNGELISYAENLYFYNVDFPFYTIRFENYDGTLIESYSVQETKKPVYEGAKPSRPATAQYTYSFKGWTPAIVAVTGDAVYTAEYDSVVNRYRITWLNADDVEIAVDSLAYGATPSHEDLVKTNTAEWTYTFVGWTPAITSVTSDATYKAQIDSVRNSYRITWLDADDTELAVDSLAYGATLSHEDLVKANTAEWTYSFVGWEPAITSVTADATYKAQFDSVRNSYRITWLNADDVEVDVDSLAYGATPSHEDLVKANTAEWTYSFVGWEPAITSVTADATYKAQFDSVRNSYRITWLNADDVEVDVDSLAYGATPSHEDVVKANTAEWTYTFVGWEPAITSVTGDATYKAQIDSVRNSYRITWLNADDVEVAVDSLAYGATPSHEDLVKTNTAEWTYTFVGWTPAITSVTGDATYKAQFDSVRNGYLVTFKNDGDTLQSTLVAYGTMPVYGGETPTKQGDAQYSYTFSGWDAELAAVTGEATYNAMFSSTVNTYLVTFKNGQDTLQSTPVAYGSMPEYTGNEPTKQADAQYTYSFNGWDAELVSVTGEATYNATFSSSVNSYLITFKNGEDTLQSTLVAYGTMPVYGGETPTKQADAQYTYSFNGWDAELVAVTGETTYNATFSSTINNYTITWLLDDGTKIDEQSVAYGTTPSHTDAHKDNTAQYTITFVGWDKAFAAVTGDETYTAVFDSVVNTYTIIFYYEDGVTVLDSKEFEYGEMPSTSLIPSLPATAKYTYTFAGWSPELQPVTGNASYSPVFDSIVNTYTVTFVNYNDMVLQSSQVPYDDVPEYTGETPIKPSNVMYHYVFTGWTPELVAVTGDARYKAVYDQVLNRYTIIFYDEDGITVLDSVEVEYGQMPETSVIPTKEDDEEYTYTFAGWSPKIVSATKNTSYTATYIAKLKTEDLWDVEAAEKAQKVMIDGVIYILRGGKIYTLDGTEVE